MCRLKYPELFNLTGNNLRDFLKIDDQESISNFLWDIIIIRVNSGSEWVYLNLFSLCFFLVNGSLFGL